MNRNRIQTGPYQRRLASRLTAVLMTVGSVAALALAANVTAFFAVAKDDPGLLSQAAEPPPIGVELLTPRSTFSDDVTFELMIGLQGGEPITMNITDPGRSVVARISVQPGAKFPWHTHPGPVVVNIPQGELVYVPAADCIERHYPAGSVFFDPGRGNVHTAYNASDEVTILIATFFEVPEEGPITITEGIEAPASCDVEVGVHSH